MVQSIAVPGGLEGFGGSSIRDVVSREPGDGCESASELVAIRLPQLFVGLHDGDVPLELWLKGRAAAVGFQSALVPVDPLLAPPDGIDRPRRHLDDSEDDGERV